MLGGHGGGLGGEVLADAEAVPAALARRRALVSLDEERVDDAPRRRHQRDTALAREPLADGADVLAGHVHDLHVAEPARLVHLRGDDERAAARLPAHEPEQPVASGVVRGHEGLDVAFGLCARRLLRRRRLGDRDAALAEPIEGAAELAPRTTCDVGLQRDERRSGAPGAELADRGDDAARVVARGEGQERVRREPPLGQRLGIDAERCQGGGRGGAPVAHEGAPVAFACPATRRST